VSTLASVLCFDMPLSALIGDISLIPRELGSPVRRSQKQQAVDILQSSVRSSSSSTPLLQPVAVLVCVPPSCSSSGGAVRFPSASV
jgi:hypothetical protein